MRTFNILGGAILAFIIAELLVGGVDLASAWLQVSNFTRIAATIMLASAFYTLRGIARQ